MKKHALSYGLLLTLVVLTACKPESTPQDVQTVSETSIAQQAQTVKLKSVDGELSLELSDNGFINKLDDVAFLASNPISQVDNKNIVLLQKNPDTLIFALKINKLDTDINQTKDTLQQNLNNDTSIESVEVKIVNDESYPAKKLTYQFTHKGEETGKTVNESCTLTTDYVICAIGTEDLPTLNGYLEKITVNKNTP